MKDIYHADQLYQNRDAQSREAQSFVVINVERHAVGMTVAILIGLWNSLITISLYYAKPAIANVIKSLRSGLQLTYSDNIETISVH